MRLPAVGKNIKLSVFCDAVQQFFTEQQYQSSTHQVKKGYHVIGRPVSPKDRRPNVVVIVEGEPDYFTIEMQPAIPGIIGAGTRIGASILGTIAGLEIKRADDKQEQYFVIEKEFWAYVIKHISELAQT